jgi:hypothetical protein
MLMTLTPKDANKYKVDQQTGSYRTGVGNSFGFAGHIRNKLGIHGPGHIHVNWF